MIHQAQDTAQAYTKNNLSKAISLPSITPYNELNIQVEHINKLYTDDKGRFPVRSRSNNQYIMIVYHCDSNAIIDAPFKSRTNKHRLLA